MFDNSLFCFQLENGAKPCRKCDNGFFPINIAGKCASAKTLEVLIRHGMYKSHSELRRSQFKVPIAAN